VGITPTRGGWGIIPTIFYAGGGITMRQFAKSFMTKHLLKAYPHPNPSGSGRVDVIPYPPATLVGVVQVNVKYQYKKCQKNV